MRIVAGMHGGRVLTSPNHDGIRPTTDRVREAMFSILASRIHLPGSRVCDLFAGSGACGLEALSRGSSTVDFVESSRRSLEVLRRNISMLGAEAFATIHGITAERFLTSARAPYDLIIADPPYDYDAHDALVETVFETSLLQPRGILVVEHPASGAPACARPGVDAETRTYGASALTFFSIGPQEDT